MLDMAFQLLMFFILTFSPMPIEAQIATMLPARGSITEAMLPEQVRGLDASEHETRQVTITVLASEAGAIRDLAVNDAIVPGLQDLRKQLDQTIDQRTPCSLVLQVDAKLRYQELVDIVQTCIQSGAVADSAIDKLTFVELRQNR